MKIFKGYFLVLLVLQCMPVKKTLNLELFDPSGLKGQGVLDIAWMCSKGELEWRQFQVQGEKSSSGFHSYVKIVFLILVFSSLSSQAWNQVFEDFRLQQQIFCLCGG